MYLLTYLGTAFTMLLTGTHMSKSLNRNGSNIQKNVFNEVTRLTDKTILKYFCKLFTIFSLKFDFSIAFYRTGTCYLHKREFLCFSK